MEHKYSKYIIMRLQLDDFHIQQLLTSWSVKPGSNEQAVVRVILEIGPI